MCKVDLIFFSSRRRHTRLQGDWSSDVCSSDLIGGSPKGPSSGPSGWCPFFDAAGLAGRSTGRSTSGRSEERRVGKSVDLGGRRIIKKKKSGTRLQLVEADRRS